jgi:hypothetical protein
MKPDDVVTENTAAHAAGMTAASLEFLKTNLEALLKLQAYLQANKLGGGREVALSITNLQQSIFWLTEAKIKI